MVRLHIGKSVFGYSPGMLSVHQNIHQFISFLRRYGEGLVLSMCDIYRSGRLDAASRTLYCGDRVGHNNPGIETIECTEPSLRHDLFTILIGMNTVGCMLRNAESGIMINNDNP